MNTLTLRTNNFDFLATVGSILKDFSNNSNIELEEFKVNDYCDEITVNAYFINSDTARQDFFGFFESIGYTVSEKDGCTDKDFYDEEDYPNGAIIIPEYVELKFYSEVKEVVYNMQYWEVKAK
jgi:hypothetical protein